MKTKVSLAAKNAFSYFALFLLTIGLLAYFILSSSSREIIQASEKNLIHTSELVKLQFSKFLTELKYDITHVSQSPLLYEYIDSEEDQLRELLRKEYMSLLKSKPHFSQIRYIGVDEGGKEIIRVDRSSQGAVEIIGDNALQNKGTRDYYLQTIGLPDDSIFISQVDLNKEFGKISQPYVPTVRMAYPVYFRNRLDGIIVINANLTELFESLEQLTDANSSLSLVDNSGYYIFYQDETKEFEFEFDKPSSFIQEFDALPGELSEAMPEVFNQGSSLVRIEAIGFPKPGYDIYIVLAADKRSLLQNYYQWRNNSFVVLGGVGLLSLLIAVLLMRRQVKELKTITETIDSFPSRLERIDLPVNRNDEIGVLTQSFNRMSEIILENIDQLEDARDKAEQAMNEKQEFLENMSHEIRNPIHTIMGLSELLYSNEHLPHQEKLIESIRLNTLNLQTLVTDVLDYRKVLSKEITLNPAWYDLGTELDRMYKIFSYSASVNKIKLQFIVDENIHSNEYFIDMTRLNQVLTNLISNGIKYTPEGGQVEIELTDAGSRDGKDILAFKVRDNGCGISAENLQRIKTRYFRTDKSNTASDGFGLGLSIVAGLLELFDSRLDLNSELGKGAEFSFNIAARSRQLQAVTDENEDPVTNSVFTDMRVLIIEDDRQIIDLYKYNLEKIFRDISYIETLSENAAVLQDSDFDVIISDYKLNNRTLAEFSHALRQAVRKNTLVYIVSASTKEEMARLDFNYRHIQKPVRIKQLCDIVCTDLARKIYGVPNLESIREDYDGNREKFEHALSLLHSEWELQRTAMLEALSRSDQEKLNAIIHKMITSVRRLELESFETLLLEIQSAEEKSLNRFTSEFKNRMDYYLGYFRQAMV